MRLGIKLAMMRAHLAARAAPEGAGAVEGVDPETRRVLPGYRYVKGGRVVKAGAK